MQCREQISNPKKQFANDIGTIKIRIIKTVP